MEKTVQEEWRPVNGFEGFYEVSSFGRVRSLHRRAPSKRKSVEWINERVMSQKTQKNGYRMVGLAKHGKCSYPYVHRLVMGAFFPNPPEGHVEVNHKDGDKSNNAVDNLEWQTPLGNTSHAWDSGLAYFHGSKSPLAKLNEQQAAEIASMIGTLSAGQIGAMFGVSATTVLSIAHGRSWQRVTGIQRRHPKKRTSAHLATA